ncbi:MAG: hypothetical protein A2X36_03815 [Elusimicrobia bacterium GWA2_69_24]|nr:MAG: hypothetical protein A2X36_03815 [Elusimicrobia bacterium GWA2_69_24]HBL18932.1 hypothetical protein [Elusimicrobiota bacterium]
MTWVQAVLLILALSLVPGPPAAAAVLADDVGYWYADIYEDFFGPDDAPGGEAFLVNRRPASRSSRFPRRKAPGTYRVFLVGGSVAHSFEDWPGDGTPPARAAGRLTLAGALARLVPGRKVELINCGMPGYDSYRESLVLDEVLRLEPDLVILMSGNNDLIASAGPPPRSFVLGLRLRRLLRLPPPRLEAREADDNPGELARRTARFDANLRGMVRAAVARMVPIVLCALPRRLGQPPTGALPLRDKGFFAGWLAWERRGYPEAERHFKDYIARNPRDSTAYHALGRILESMGDRAGALAAFRLSQTLEIDAVVRRTAREEGAPLADLEGAFERAAGGPRLEGLLYDRVHWHRFADPIVSLAVAEALAPRPGLSPETALPGAFRPDPVELEETYWLRAAAAVRESLLMPSGSQPDKGRFNEGAVGLFEALWKESPDAAAELPGRKEFLIRLEREKGLHIGPSEDLAGLWPSALAHAAEACARLGRWDPALRLFDEALRLEPRFPYALLRRSVALHRAGRAPEAEAGFAGLREAAWWIAEIDFYREALFPRRTKPAPGK